MKNNNAVRKLVKTAYGRVVERAGSCCGGSPCCGHTALSASEEAMGLSCGRQHP